MSLVFVLVAVSVVLLLATVIFSTAYESSGSNAAALDNIFDILQTQMELTTMLPFVLAIVMFLAVVGVFSRI
jgi:hypothetical protein